MRKSISDIANYKGSKKIVMLTAYTYPLAKIIDEHADIILVGDSLGMVLYGMDSTLPVTLDMMINHTKAVVKATEKAAVITDMPYGSYEDSSELAIASASKIISETECDGIKLEGGVEMADNIKAITDSGINVIGHVGLMPQSVEKYGGYKIQGKDQESSNKILDDALAVQQAGASMIVIEGVKKEVAEMIVDKVKIPTIGIGASPKCDGQVLVTEDMLGLSIGKKAKFVKQYANLNEQIEQAIKKYSEEVTNGQFPTDENCY